MRTDKPFEKSFTCAGVLCAIYILGLRLALGGMSMDSFARGQLIGALAAPFLFSGLVAGAWCSYSKKSWSWVRIALTVVGFSLLFILLLARGH